MDFVGIDKFSLLDYDEMVSVVLFAPGCNFRCPFCHNIQGVVDSKQFIPFDEIMDFLKSRTGVIDAVVISGGEPTLMPDLKDKIIQIRKLGFKIKLDSNGTRPNVIKELIDEKLIDYVAMDIKNHLDKYDLVTATKVNKDVIQESIDLLMNSGIDYEFRTTLVNEYHTDKDMHEIGKLIANCKRFYLQKYVYRDGVINKNLHPVDEVKALYFVSILKNYMPNVELRGY